MHLNRRNFLKHTGAAGLGLSLTPSLLRAAQSSDYKALVCVFLYGGMDNHDTVLPYDQPSYNEYARIRQTLIQGYGGSRNREQLLPIDSGNASSFGGRSFALPPELSGFHQLYGSGKGAIIGNVGPLIQRTDATSFGSALLPPRLFSHNDQQALWMSSSPEGSQFGWGGLLADGSQNSFINASPEFTAINGGGSDLFLTGRNTNPYRISGSGASKMWIIDEALQEGHSQDLVEHFRGSNFQGTNLLRRDVANMMVRAHDSNTRYDRAVGTSSNFSTTFPTTGLGTQLQGVAKAISIRQTLGARRQVFMVGMGGFDTHDAQASLLPNLHRTLDQAIAAFQQSMVELGLDENVTLFTASDFGRTLSVNGNGTDHGWGGNSLVVGGAVKGGKIYGDLPPSTLGHNQDSGNGRWIPTTSVEEFASPLGSWFGLSNAEIRSALPDLGSFPSHLDFI